MLGCAIFTTHELAKDQFQKSFTGKAIATLLFVPSVIFAGRTFFNVSLTTIIVGILFEIAALGLFALEGTIIKDIIAKSHAHLCGTVLSCIGLFIILEESLNTYTYIYHEEFSNSFIIAVAISACIALMGRFTPKKGTGYYSISLWIALITFCARLLNRPIEFDRVCTIALATTALIFSIKNDKIILKAFSIILLPLVVFAEVVSIIENFIFFHWIVLSAFGLALVLSATYFEKGGKNTTDINEVNEQNNKQFEL